MTDSYALSELLPATLDDGVLSVTFNRPRKKNAINTEMWAAMRDIFSRADGDPEVACILIQGAGEDFSAGVDLSSFGDAPEGEEHPFEAAARAVAACNKPMVAAAKGVAVGGGATILFHADIVYGGETLRMRLPFASLGLVPEFGSSYMLPAIIGAQRAAELMYTADWIDAERALQLGLLAAVLPVEALEAAALQRARDIAQWPVTALREIKVCMKAGQRGGLDAAIALEQEGMYRLAGSPENIEAVTALFEKRAPDFKQFRHKNTGA